MDPSSPRPPGRPDWERVRPGEVLPSEAEHRPMPEAGPMSTDPDRPDRPRSGDDAGGPDPGRTTPSDPAQAIRDRAEVEELDDIEEWPDFDLESEPPEPEESPGRQRLSAPDITPAARRLWFVGISFLIVATIVALVPLVGAVAPAIGRSIGAVTSLAGSAVGNFQGQWGEWTRELQARAATIPQAQIAEQRQITGSASLLVVVTNDASETVGIVLLARSDDTEPAVVLVPPTLFDILPGYGDFSLADATVFEGPELTAVTLANGLGIRIDDILEISPAELAGVAGRPLAVDLSSPFVIADADGTERVVAAAGLSDRPAEVVELLLSAEGTGDQLEFMSRQAAVWEALFDVMALDASVTDRLGAFSSGSAIDAVRVLASTASGEPQVTVVPVTRVSVRGAEEGFKIASVEAAQFVENRLGHLQLNAGERPRVEILNGNGRVLATRAVAEMLIRNGFRVIKTDNAENFEFRETVVISQGRENRQSAETIVNLLRTGELLLEIRAPSGVVDVSIIVGQDIPSGEFESG